MSQGNPIPGGHRVVVIMDDKDIGLVTDYQFKWRFPNRSDAIRDLIAAGLRAAAQQEDE